MRHSSNRRLSLRAGGPRDHAIDLHASSSETVAGTQLIERVEPFPAAFDRDRRFVERRTERSPVNRIDHRHDCGVGLFHAPVKTRQVFELAPCDMCAPPRILAMTLQAAFFNRRGRQDVPRHRAMARGAGRPHGVAFCQRLLMRTDRKCVGFGRMTTATGLRQRHPVHRTRRVGAGLDASMRNARVGGGRITTVAFFAVDAGQGMLRRQPLVRVGEGDERSGSYLPQMAVHAIISHRFLG